MLTLFFLVGVFSDVELNMLLPFIPFDFETTVLDVYYGVSRFFDVKVLKPDFLLIPIGMYFPFYNV